MKLVRLVIVGFAVWALCAGCTEFVGAEPELPPGTTGSSSSTSGSTGAGSTVTSAASTSGAPMSSDAESSTTGRETGVFPDPLPDVPDPGCTASPELLFLDDGSPHVEPLNGALAAAGVLVRNVGAFDRWDGQASLTEDIDAVLYLNGENYSADLRPEAHAVLVDFVAAGGTLIRTEWSAWNQGTRGPDGSDALLPVDYAGSYTSGAFWEPVVPGDPLAAGVSAAGWVEASQCSAVTPRAGAEVVFRGDTCGPVVTRWQYGAGSVLHINSTFFAVQDSPNLQRLLVNAVLQADACM